MQHGAMVRSRQARATVLAPMELELFAACLPGLEPLLAAELAALGATPEPQPGGVAFRGSRDLLLRAHLHVGTASHLLLRCAKFRCLELAELERKIASMPWLQWAERDAVIEVDATARKSRLYHTGAIEERTQKGIAAALGVDFPRVRAAEPTPTQAAQNKRASNKPLSAAARRGRGPNAKNPDPKWLARQAELAEARKKQEAEATARAEAAERERLATAPRVRVAVRFVDDVATLSIDTSDTPLHRRGYRLETGKAPLREDLAFAMLRAAGFAKGMSLLDPFCGSGTIAIEAACMAAGLPPGRLRPPPLRGLAIADDAAWSQLIAKLPPAPDHAPANARIAASDRDQGAIAAATENARRAGVAACIEFSNCAVSKAPWLSDPTAAPTNLLVATNPPFGRRVATGRDLLPLYQTLGRLVSGIDGARAAILAQDVRLCRSTGLELKAAFTTRHGGLSVACMLG